MSVKVDIWNMALGHIGQQDTISSDTEKSSARFACSRFWENAYKATFRDFDMPFSRKTATLQLVSTNPTDEWGYAYSYPVDCVKFRKIVSSNIQDTDQSKIPFEISQNAAGSALLIYTNQAQADGKYTVDVSIVNLWPEDFQLAVSLRLAAYIAPGLTKGDPFGLGEKAFKLYERHASMAASNAAAEDGYGMGPVNSFEESRS